MSTPSFLSLFVSRPGESRSRNSSSLYRSLYYGSNNGVPRVMKRRTMKDEIMLFYARLCEAQPAIPVYLSHSVYASLVKQQHEIFSKRNLKKRKKNRGLVKSAANQQQQQQQEDEEVEIEQQEQEELFPLFNEPLERMSSAAAAASTSASTSNKSNMPTAQEISNLENLFTENSFYFSIAIQDLRLPSSWDVNSMGDNISFSTDNLQLTYKGGDKEDDEASSARANYPMRKQCGIYYFEIKIISKGVDGHIGIGFCAKINSLNRLPGWEDRSWGYHGNDGQVRSGPGANRQYGPKFSTGDIIGCCIDFRDMSAFYTKNGIHLGIAFRKIKEKDLYPFVGFKTQGEQIEVNFGSKPFKFDIQQYMSNEKRKLLNSIALTTAIHDGKRGGGGKRKINPNTTPAGVATIKESMTCHLADQVVMEYLEHHGYNKSAKLLESALISKRESTGAISDENDIDLDDTEALQRQEIRKLILEGNIDGAVELCDKYYPGVLENNHLVMFRLKCRKFIEMVKVAQLNSDNKPESSASASASTSASMENNMEAESLEVSNTKGKRPMENICDLPNKKQKTYDMEERLSKAMMFGMELKKEYDPEAQENPEMAAELRTTFAILAYRDLSDPAVSYLYETPCIEQVASQVNSAILVSLNRYPNSSLERIYRQTSVAIEKLVIVGNPNAALLEPERDCLNLDL